MKYFNKLKSIPKDVKAITGLIAGIGLLGGFFYLTEIRDNVRERTHKYLSEARKTEYSQEIGNCMVTVYKNDLDLELTVEELPENSKKGTKIELRDWPSFYTGKLGGIDKLIINGKVIYADDVSKDLIKPYEKMMNEKLESLEDGLRELAAKLKPVFEEQEKAKKEAARKRATKIMEKHVGSLPDMCSE